MTNSTLPSAPIEVKVKASTFLAFVVGVVISILNGVQENPDLLGFFPPIVQALLLTLIPPLVVFAAGYRAPHTSRAINTGNDPYDS